MFPFASYTVNSFGVATTYRVPVEFQATKSASETPKKAKRQTMKRKRTGNHRWRGTIETDLLANLFCAQHDP
jgi:hypothetical protein